MKITIERPNHATAIIDTANCIHPWAYRSAIEEALRLEGLSQEMINEIFGIMPEAVEAF
jgi:hypothetical protein